MRTSRRGRGEGSIVKRADGRWMGRVDLGWQEGKRRTKSVYGRTRRAAADAVRDALRALQDGTLRTDERQTVGQFLATWLQDVARARVRPRTLSGYESVVEQHILPELGRFRVSKLNGQDLQMWLAKLEAGGVSASRRRYAKVVLRTALNTALRWRLISSNAATLVDSPRVSRREIRPLTPEEAKRLLSASSGHPLEAFVVVALGCGLRIGESLGLQWGDVDLEAGRLHVGEQCRGSAGTAPHDESSWPSGNG
ncbi:MAG: tyrosine-type recombinase/integrase [Gemmatimonadetes bacterium]|nr:tyrosine-type recombinase/integrase [Gemmatimonadota bacterium]